MAEKFKKMTTAAGVLVYPHLHAPDTKFAEGGAGLWKTDFRMTADKAAPYIAAIDELIEQVVETTQKMLDEKAKKADPKAKPGKVKPKIANPPYSVDEETGDVTFRFKRNASYKKDGEEKSMSPPLLYDSLNQKIPYGTRVGAGSVGKVAFSLMPFPNYTPTIGAGIKLGLEAVQLLTVVEFGGASGDRFGFSAEGGEETPEEETTTTQDGGAEQDF